MLPALAPGTDEWLAYVNDTLPKWVRVFERYSDGFDIYYDIVFIMRNHKELIGRLYLERIDHRVKLVQIYGTSVFAASDVWELAILHIRKFVRDYAYNVGLSA